MRAFGVVDRVIGEPLGGAHREPKTAIAAAGDAIEAALGALDGLDGEALRARRHEKFLEIGRKGVA